MQLEFEAQLLWLYSIRFVWYGLAEMPLIKRRLQNAEQFVDQVHFIPDE